MRIAAWEVSMQKAMSRALKTMLLMVCLLDFVNAQEVSARPCVILKLPNGRKYNPTYQYVVNPETLKGTCYYDPNGVITHWIVRWWDDSSDQPSLNEKWVREKEFVGYPSALNEQKRYNSEIHSTLGGADFGPPPYGTCRTNGDLDYPAKYAPCWNKLPQGRKAWVDFTRHINVPRSILETGELNADTLRIPLFETGIRLLHAQTHFLLVCGGADEDYDIWMQNHAESGFAQENNGNQGDEVGFCDPQKERPRNSILAEYQRVMQSIGAELDAAQD